MAIYMIALAVLTAMDTVEIQQGIDRQTKLGKPFILPAGIHVAGTLKLRNGTHFQFAPGAVLKMLPRNSDFAPIEQLTFNPYADLETSRFEHALLFASDAERVTIDGPGRIQCDRSGRGGPKAISLRRTKQIRIQGLTIDHAPNYAISLIDCAQVDLGGLKITQGLADGIVLDGTRDAYIHDSEVDSFDDSICLKSSGSLGRKMTTRNLKVERCRLRSASVHFKLGTESYGDFEGIQVRNLTMVGGAGNRHGNPGIALETVDGGRIRNVEISDVQMQEVGTPIFLRIGDRKLAPGNPGVGEMTGIKLLRVRSQRSRHASVIAGLNDAPIRNLTIEDVEVEPLGESGDYNPNQAVSEKRDAYPEPIQFGPIPASAFFFRHVSGLRLKDLRYSRPAPVPAIVLDHVSGTWPQCRQVSSTRSVCSGLFASK